MTPSPARPLALLLTLLLAAGCGSQSRAPDWMSGPPEAYPQSRYITATGDAGSREASAERALANLARVFSVSVSDTSLDFAVARVEGQGEDARTSGSAEASRFITAEARQVLEGARIVEVWQDPEGLTHSLAVLDKGPAAQRFRRDIDQADRRTTDLIRFASGAAPNPVAALSALDQARRLQIDRDYANRNLTVVSGRGVSSPTSTAEIESLIRRGLATLAFATRAPSRDMESSLQGAIAGLGIRYDPQSPYVLEGELDHAPVHQRQGWYWLRGSAQLRLSRDGGEIARKRWPVKVSATDQGMVEQRARDLLSGELESYLYDMLVSAGSAY